VLIVVGGPQYRAGSHRQFVLLARHLAAQGVPVLRFDYRGMGDSDGDLRTFEDLNDDLRCAIDSFLNQVPSLNELAIWGLCDAASAAVFYAYQDKRVTGLVLLNPWVRTDEGAATVYLKHYYAARLFEPQLWNKILRGRFNYQEAIQSFVKTARIVLRRKKRTFAIANMEEIKSCDRAPLPERMLTALSRFQGRLLLIISGNDLTAQEFLDVVNASPEWQKLLASPRVSRLDLPEATHTFSRREWRDQVAVWTKEWMQSW
jgi:exosortase A-associated hydrolase 1